MFCGFSVKEPVTQKIIWPEIATSTVARVRGSATHVPVDSVPTSGLVSESFDRLVQ